MSHDIKHYYHDGECGISVYIAGGTSKDDTPDRLANFISNTNISDNAKLFSKDPHPAGGTKNLELASEIMNRWNSYGFSDVFENDYQVLLSLPTENR